MTESVLLIDGDVLAYKACEKRNPPKNGGDHVVSLDDGGAKRPLHELYTADENAEYLQQSWANFKRNVARMAEDLFMPDYLMAVKGPNNFRDDLYTEYKKPRALGTYHQQLAPFVPAIRKLAVHEGMAIPAEGREADDYLRIWANQCRMHGIDYIIASIDKDLLCIPGRHYRIKEKKIIEVSEIEAMRHYYAQLLQGDPTDNIPGVPGLGPVKAEKLVGMLTDEEEMQEVVIAHYFDAYGEEGWQNQLVSNGKMIHIQNTPEDYFTLKNWPLANELLGR